MKNCGITSQLWDHQCPNFGAHKDIIRKEMAHSEYPMNMQVETLAKY